MMAEEITRMREIKGADRGSLYLLIPASLRRQVAKAKYWKIRIEKGGRRIIAEAVG